MRIQPPELHYLYLIAVNGAEDPDICAPRGFKFGRSQNPMRRLQEHRANVPGSRMAMWMILVGDPADVLRAETTIIRCVKANRFKWHRSGEWVEMSDDFLAHFCGLGDPAVNEAMKALAPEVMSWPMAEIARGALGKMSTVG
jgi:hypothetical protein